MWVISETHKATKHIDELPKQVLEKFEFWKSVDEISGPVGLRKFPGFRDHMLKGKWKWHRSSWLSETYRVIYLVVNRDTQIIIADVVHHDYRRKRDAGKGG